MKQVIRFLVLCLVMIVMQPSNLASANDFTVTPGVDYKKGASSWKNKPQSIHTVVVDVNRPEITVDAIIPNPLNARQRLTNLLKANSYDGHQVVAGINASFFHTNSGAPAYLLSTDGVVNTYGAISTGNDEYMSVPTAFGIDEHGKGQMGRFGYEATMKIGDAETKITSVNKARTANEVILFTPSYSYDSTRADKFGIEFIITGLSKSIEEGYQLGEEVTGKVAGITPYGSRDSKIPADGVVVSIQGGAQAAPFNDVQVGDEVSLFVDLQAPFKNADFVLASGPLLVQNGKVDMTISQSSWRATSINPRTAVAINKDGSKVFLVTVDGRSAGSTGMNLRDFSEYLVSIGAHTALNLDGGGSTTMAVRKRGEFYPSLFNKPSDNYERAISAALGAVSLTKAVPETFEIIGGHEVAPNDSVQFMVKAYDANGYELAQPQEVIQWTASPQLGAIQNGLLKTNESGEGTITATIGTKTISKSVKIINGGKLVHSFEQASEWTADSARATTSLRFDGAKAPVKEGKTALTLSYNFTAYKTGTSASYAVAKKPIQLSAKPTSLGLWVYGDGAGHWLRGQITDQAGKTHAIDFTQSGQLTWKGWKYVKAAIPANVVGPISLNRIYIAETSETKKNRGSIYLDRLVAEYGNSHKEALFNDVPLSHRAAEDIQYAVEKGWILGDTDGTFKPDNSISRAHAAVLISRVLNLSSNKPTTFKDVPTTHRYSKEIAAVVEAGIMSGKNPTTFDPDGFLTRVQMAKVLVNAYELTADPSEYDILSDVPKDHWGFDDAHILRANGVTVVDDGKFRPFEQVKRYQIAAFLTRIDQQ